MTKQEKQFDDYLAELDAAEEKAAEQAWEHGGGYHASKGDYEGACYARAEFDSGQIS